MGEPRTRMGTSNKTVFHLSLQNSFSRLCRMKTRLRVSFEASLAGACSHVNQELKHQDATPASI